MLRRLERRIGAAVIHRIRNWSIAVILAGAGAGAIVGILIVALSDHSHPTDLLEIERIVRDVLQAETQDGRPLEQFDDAAMAQILDRVLERVDPPLHERVVDAYARVASSIVLISAEGEERTNEEGLLYQPLALGTGIVLDERGNIVTAAHVIEDTERIEVILPGGERADASLISSDAPFSDVAVLRVELDGLQPAAFGSAGGLSTGEHVLAVGNVLLGEEIAMTLGVVSRPDTEFARERYIQDDLIQTDAALNFGNSGGALVNLEGEVVGLTTVIARETRDGDFVDGVGFAIRIEQVLQIARTIAADGYYPRPTFGVVNERLLTPQAAAQLGLSVSEGAFLLEIKRSGVFARAGIRPGDVIRELDEVTIDEETPYINALSQLRPGVEVRVVIHRDGRDMDLLLAPELRLP